MLGVLDRIWGNSCSRVRLTPGFILFIMSIIPIAIVTEWGREEWYGILGNVHCRAPLDRLMVVVYTLGNKIRRPAS